MIEFRYELYWCLFQLRNIVVRNGPLVVALDDIRFRIHPRGSAANGCWLGVGLEKPELRFLMDYLKPGMIFLDIGSNAGIYTLAAATKFDDLQIVAVEPCQKTFELLQANIALNGLSVQTIRTALSDESGQAELYVNVPRRDGLNALRKPLRNAARIAGQETVAVDTLDNMISGLGIDHVDAMKVDVEGAELAVFKGGKQLLGNDNAPLILFESRACNTAAFDYHPREFFQYLESLGNSLFRLDETTATWMPYTGTGEEDGSFIATKHPEQIRPLATVP
ncbi:FkbM family methyltransferase [Verrucomicrobiota bacterium]